MMPQWTTSGARERDLTRWQSELTSGIPSRRAMCLTRYSFREYPRLQRCNAPGLAERFCPDHPRDCQNQRRHGSANGYVLYQTYVTPARS